MVSIENTVTTLSVMDQRARQILDQIVEKQKEDPLSREQLSDGPAA